jgi:transcriptional regulator with XRE-family HTH domain
VLQNSIVTLGKRIEAKRLALGLSQNQLAKRAGLNHPTLHKIEAGQRTNPSITTVMKIARALGTSVEALVSGEPAESAAAKGRRSRKAAPLDLAEGGYAVLDALRSLQKRVDELEAWRHKQEGPGRKRASR